MWVRGSSIVYPMCMITCTTQLTNRIHMYFLKITPAGTSNRCYTVQFMTMEITIIFIFKFLHTTHIFNVPPITAYFFRASHSTNHLLYSPIILLSCSILKSPSNNLLSILSSKFCTIIAYIKYQLITHATDVWASVV